ncbi:hypothetical protein CMO89_00405 [Candidatus Woesearchaeota archaeon]|nr:hypothetical protein [Candidatus Woesearchaeota archaeon]|tara:strand:+ start:11173 stop:12105 length:933 start_codon:yes stop_codon:yes gene_type:complete
MSNDYILKNEEGKFLYDNLLVLSPEKFRLINHPMNIKLIKLLAKKPMYVTQIAKELKEHEQNVYYHIKNLLKADILDVAEREEIRGTVAKKYAPKQLNFAFSLSDNWKSLSQLIKKGKDKKLNQFLQPFIEKEELNANIIVGSPEPHGPFKARARDGHYAIDLGLFLGNYCSLRKDFSVKLDVDVNLKKDESNLIVVGGPVTNLIMAEINKHLPVKFSDKKPWGIVSQKASYTEENIGLIAKIPNPYYPELRILVVAGVRFTGTKSAIIGLTRLPELVLNRFSNQKEFYCILQGFDLDGDGKVDSVEVLE